MNHILHQTDGEDGLKFYKIIINEGYNYLNENGILALEIGFDQKEEVIKIVNNSHKYKDVYCIKDLYGNDRVIVAKKQKGEKYVLFLEC